MIAFFLLLVLIAVVLGFLGVVIKSLAFLLFIGIFIFVVALTVVTFRLRRRGHHEERLESLERTRRRRWRKRGV